MCVCLTKKEKKKTCGKNLLVGKIAISEAHISTKLKYSFLIIFLILTIA